MEKIVLKLEACQVTLFKDILSDCVFSPNASSSPWKKKEWDVDFFSKMILYEFTVKNIRKLALMSTKPVRFQLCVFEAYAIWYLFQRVKCKEQDLFACREVLRQLDLPIQRYLV